MEGEIKCPIWGTQSIVLADEGWVQPTTSEPVLTQESVIISDRAGGAYRIEPLVNVWGFAKVFTDQEKARLTTWLVDQRLQGIEAPLVTEQTIEYVKYQRALSVHERAERLLRFLAGLADTVGTGVDVNKFTHAAYAWSESLEWKDIVFFLNYLRESGWLQQGGGYDAMYQDVGLVQGIVTVAGHNRIAERATNIDSAQAFVAMWFDDSVASAYDEGIAPAIRDCGFKAKRIDRDPRVDKIDDAIIAEIRRSRFLVADFTHGDEGARGGVYYEAGFAHGLGIPVIFACRGDMIDQIHFDTRQYAHIVWNSASELRNDLRDRILARIGEGSNIVQ